MFVLCALMTLYYVFSSLNDYRVFHLPNDVFINPALNKNSIKNQAPYIFDISADSLDKNFGLILKNLPKYLVAQVTDEGFSVSTKIVRLSDDVTLYLGSNINCDFLVSTQGLYVCNEQLYQTVEKDLSELIIEKNIGRYWLWELRNDSWDKEDKGVRVNLP